MNLKKIEDEALLLSDEERAELAQKLILSLGTPSKKDSEDDWLTEACRRAEDIDKGIVEPIPVEEVRKKAKDLLR